MKYKGVWRYYLLGFFIPVIFVLLILWKQQFWPFGDQIMLSEDLDIQYIDFFGYYLEVVRGNASLAYSFGKSLGGNMVALFAYYLSSPLNLLVVLFDKAQLPSFIACLAILRYGLAGLTASFYFRQRFRQLNYWGLCFGTAYALSQYMLVNMRNPMWIDAVILLPLIFHFVYQYIQHGTRVGLYLLLTATIFSNWYTAYMVCLMTLVYFVFEWLEKEEYRWRINAFLGHFLTFAGTLLLAVTTTGVLFLPNILSLRNGKGDGFADLLFRAKYFGITDIPASFLPASSIGAPKEILFYSGTMVFLLLLAYVVNNHLALRERVFSGLLILVLCCVPMISYSDTIWSSLKPSVGFGTRYSFCFILFFLVIAAKSALHFSQMSQRRCWLVGLITACILGFSAWRQGLTVISLLGIASMLLFLLGNAFSNMFYRWRRLFFVCLLLCFSAELLVNIDWSYQHVYTGRSYQDYQQYVQQAEVQQDTLQAYDQGYYRSEQTTNRIQPLFHSKIMNNEALAYGLYGIQHYSSTYDQTTDQLLASLGYNIAGDTDFPYNYPLVVSDSLLGIKYVYSDVPPVGYQPVKEIPRLYKNSHALSFGFFIPKPLAFMKEQNPFEYQNQLFQAFTGSSEKLFQDITAEGRQTSVSDGLSVTYPSHPGNKLFVYQSSQLRLFTEYEGADLSINDRFYAKAAGRFHEGTIAYEATAPATTIRVRKPADNLSLNVYTLNEAVFEEMINQLKQTELKVNEIAGNKLNGEIHAAFDGLLLLTIPYDTGWQVQVNNQPQSIVNQNGFMAVAVSKGSNRINLRYQPPGIVLGSLLTLASLLGFVGWEYWRRCQQRTK